MVTTSFLMVDGHVRNFTGHMDRLAAAAPITAQFDEPIRAKLRAAKGQAICAVTVENNHFSVETRPARPIKPTITVDIHGHRDERSQPTVKGVDSAWQDRASATSRRQGADEGLLIDESGKVIGAVNASLFVLQGSMVFHSTHPRHLPSVLEGPILDYLRLRGASSKARAEGFDINELRAAEVWLIDSLNGIRRVNSWLEYGSALQVSEVRPVAAFIPTFSEVNAHLWESAEEI